MAVEPPGHVPPSFTAYEFDGLRVLLSARHGAWLTGLANDFELAWATSWEDDADRLIAERVGLPRGLPVIRFDAAQTGWMDKLPDVIQFVGDRPTAWLDDDLGPEAHAWAAARAVPTLLVQPDHRIGLTEAHIDNAPCVCDRPARLRRARARASDTPPRNDETGASRHPFHARSNGADTRT